MRLVPAERIQSASELLAALTAPSREVTGLKKRDQLREKSGHDGPAAEDTGHCGRGGAAGDHHLRHRHPEPEPAPQAGLVLQPGHSVLGCRQALLPVPRSLDYTLPSFTGRQVQDVTGNSEYLKYCMFSTEYEFSDEYDEGEIISQTPSCGHEDWRQHRGEAGGEQGRLRRPPSPEDIGGMSLGDIKAKLYSLGIAENKVQVVTQENDGTYAENQFIKMDPVPGTAVKIGDNGGTRHHLCGGQAARAGEDACGGGQGARRGGERADRGGHQIPHHRGGQHHQLCLRHRD